MKLPIEETDILQFIPQRPPMVMVSRLTEHNEICTKSELKLDQNNMFCENGRFQASGMLENIAQTAALRMGYIAKLEEVTKIPVGYIGAISKVKIHDLPEDTATLNTSVQVLQEVFGVNLIRGEVNVGNQCIAECEMKIVVKK